MNTHKKAPGDRFKMHIVVPALYVAVLVALLISSIINS